MNFEISTANKIIPTDIYGLSRNLILGAEVFQIDDSGRRSIGILSHKALIYIVSEFASYAMQNFLPKGNGDAKGLIKMVKAYADGASSIPDNEIFKYANVLNSVIYSGYTTLNNGNTTSNAISTADYAAMAAPSGVIERGRQGEFIVDFLKSNKALFML